uniref:Metastasis-associated protein MTA3 n=1 Tax=Macrostomum lignano TaxID=282301 RepID=A0A1I8HDX8_9PLAT
MAANMYRVGDYVYFETSASGPYQIRRIEELTKTPTGNVEAKVMCFFRRRDISNNLISQADKHLSLDDEPSAAGEAEAASSEPSGGGLTEVQRHQLRHRELFLSRQVETLPATTIRGKCAVTLLNETEALTSYLARDDAFYYTLTYDTAQKSLLADRGEIRVGGRYQAEVQPLLGDGESDGRDLAQLEELVWRPDHGLSDADIDKYLLVARSVGCLARAVDACSSVRQPGLAAAAAAASRDYTQAHAYRMLHSSKYDLGRAFCRLVTDSGPVLCRDQLEDWSASECNLFEEAMNKFGKDFNEIRRDYLSWKSMRSIVEYFYMWKTTDRYVQQKRLKASEAEKKLKQVYIPNYTKPNSHPQVYIPNYTKPNPGVLYNRPELPGSSRCCESCSGTATSNGQWFAWGPPHLSCRLCSSCWNYWKRYGGLKNPTRAEKSPSPAPSAASGAGSSGRVFRCPVVDCDKEFRLRPQLVRHAASAHGLDEASLQSMQAGKVKAVKSMLMRANATAQLASLLCSDLLRVRRLAAARSTRPSTPSRRCWICRSAARPTVGVFNSCSTRRPPGGPS